MFNYKTYRNIKLLKIKNLLEKIIKFIIIKIFKF